MRRVQELTQRALSISLRPGFSFQYYVSGCDQAFSAGMAAVYREDWETAYIYLLRFTDFVIEKLPHHRDYSASLVYMEHLNNKAEEALTLLMDIKLYLKSLPEPVSSSEPVLSSKPVSSSEPVLSPEPVLSSKPVSSFEPVLSPELIAESDRATEFWKKRMGQLTTVPSKPSTPVKTARSNSLSLPQTLGPLFLEAVRGNTTREIESCGILCSTAMEPQKVVAVVLPEQFGTSDTCTTQNEEKLFGFMFEKELICVGWIHTHPTQSCFLSSVDLHTHFLFQTLHPAAVAVVCAPRDKQRPLGVFRLTGDGLSVLAKCTLTGFHSHGPGILFSEVTDVVWDTTPDLSIFDLRL